MKVCPVILKVRDARRTWMGYVSRREDGNPVNAISCTCQWNEKETEAEDNMKDVIKDFFFEKVG